MTEQRHGGAGAVFILLIVVGFVAKFFWWIVAALGGPVLFGVLLWLAFYAARRVDVRDAAQRALIARADQQHRWVLTGDDRGIYGDYPPAAM